MRFGALVSAKNLADHLFKSSHDIRVLDASYFLAITGVSARENFKKEHIPGAQFFDIDGCITKSPYEHMLPSVPDFEKYVGSLGIDNNTHVVVYNNHPDFAIFSAPRVWWTFRAFGHNLVSVLDGGLRAWKNENLEVTSKVEEPPLKKFKATFIPDLVKSYEDVLENLESKKFQLVDARAPARFFGQSPEPRNDCQPGHIPGSTNIPFMAVQTSCTNVDGSVTDKGALKTSDEIKAIFEIQGVDTSKPIVASCGSGVTACNLAFAAYLFGKEDVPVYDGAWLEWFKKSSPSQRESCPEN